MSTPAPAPDSAGSPEPGIRFNSARGRWVLFATVLGSGIGFLDGTVVNVALPAIGRDFNAGFDTLQWVLDAYLLMLGALVLIGGDLGDTFGRRRMFCAGLLGFGAASAVCGLAQSALALDISRGVQGGFAALLVPGSLAILSSSFVPADRGRAIGAWSGMSGLTTVLGPFLGGFLVDHASWRWVFLINLPLVLVALLVALRHVPAAPPPPQDVPAWRRIDIPGAALCAAGLGLLIAALIQGPRGNTSIAILAGVAGVGLLAAFIAVEATRRRPMLPLAIFGSRDFSVTNLCTVALYGPLGGGLFLVVIELQRVLHYSALGSGVALLPISFLLLALSARVGRTASRWGARPLMAAGSFLAAIGFALLTRIDISSGYVSAVLPGILVFGLGISLFVAPLTSTAMSSVSDRFAGVASGVNNAAARIASLLAVALLPLVSGLAAVAVDDDPGYTAAFHRAMWYAGASCAVAGGLALVGLSRSAGRAIGAGGQAAQVSAPPPPPGAPRGV